MDIDIDDILDELDRDTTAVERDSSAFIGQGDITQGNDISQLKDGSKDQLLVDEKSVRIDDYQKLAYDALEK